MTSTGYLRRILLGEQKKSVWFPNGRMEQGHRRRYLSRVSVTHECGISSPRLTLPHNNAAHKYLNWTDPLQWNLSFPRRLPQSQLMPQLLLTDRIRMVDFIAQDQKGDFGEVFHREEGVELSFGFGKTFQVFGVDEEDNSADFRKIVPPETAGWESGDRQH